jgi:hypothetical protein
VWRLYQLFVGLHCLVSPQVPETLVETIQFVFTHISPLDMHSIWYMSVFFLIYSTRNPPIHIRNVGGGFTNHLSPWELSATIYKIMSLMYRNSLSAFIRPNWPRVCTETVLSFCSGSAEGSNLMSQALRPRTAEGPNSNLLLAWLSTSVIFFCSSRRITSN